MFNASNYYQQSQGLPVENEFQLLHLKLVDGCTFIREMSKCLTIAGLTASASSLVFNFDPTSAITCTAIFGACWLGSSALAQKCEPHAKEMIEYFKDLQGKKHILPRHRAKAAGLIE